MTWKDALWGMMISSCWGVSVTDEQTFVNVESLSRLKTIPSTNYSPFIWLKWWILCSCLLKLLLSMLLSQRHLNIDSPPVAKVHIWRITFSCGGDSSQLTNRVYQVSHSVSWQIVGEETNCVGWSSSSQRRNCYQSYLTLWQYRLFKIVKLL